MERKNAKEKEEQERSWDVEVDVDGERKREDQERGDSKLKKNIYFLFRGTKGLRPIDDMGEVGRRKTECYAYFGVHCLLYAPH